MSHAEEGVQRISGCTVTEDGHCAAHGAEIERRRSVVKEVDQLRRDVDKNINQLSDFRTFEATAKDDVSHLLDESKVAKNHIGDLLTHKNRANGAIGVLAVIGCMLISGAYMYAYTISVSSNARMDRAFDRINLTDDSLTVLSNRLTEIATRMDERQLSWLREREETNRRIGETNRQIEHLVTVISEVHGFPLQTPRGGAN